MYQEVTDIRKLYKILENKQLDYNYSSNDKLDLVFFDDAVEAARQQIKLSPGNDRDRNLRWCLQWVADAPALTSDRNDFPGRCLGLEVLKYPQQAGIGVAGKGFKVADKHVGDVPD